MDSIVKSKFKLAKNYLLEIIAKQMILLKKKCKSKYCKLKFELGCVIEWKKLLK